MCGFTTRPKEGVEKKWLGLEIQLASFEAAASSIVTLESLINANRLQIKKHRSTQVSDSLGVRAFSAAELRCLENKQARLLSCLDIAVKKLSNFDDGLIGQMRQCADQLMLLNIRRLDSRFSTMEFVEGIPRRDCSVATLKAQRLQTFLYSYRSAKDFVAEWFPSFERLRKSSDLSIKRGLRKKVRTTELLNQLHGVFVRCRQLKATVDHLAYKLAAIDSDKPVSHSRARTMTDASFAQTITIGHVFHGAGNDPEATRREPSLRLVASMPELSSLEAASVAPHETPVRCLISLRDQVLDMQLDLQVLHREYSGLSEEDEHGRRNSFSSNTSDASVESIVKVASFSELHRNRVSIDAKEQGLKTVFAEMVVNKHLRSINEVLTAQINRLNPKAVDLSGVVRRVGCKVYNKLEKASSLTDLVRDIEGLNEVDQLIKVREALKDTRLTNRRGLKACKAKGALKSIENILQDYIRQYESQGQLRAEITNGFAACDQLRGAVAAKEKQVIEASRLSISSPFLGERQAGAASGANGEVSPPPYF